MKWALVVIVVAACSKTKSKAPPPSGASYTQQVKAWADRACQCGEDRKCVKPIRDEWDQVKYDYRDAAEKFSPADRQAYDAELTHFKMCGDAAGLTIWTN
jgi:hypothetical protein